MSFRAVVALQVSTVWVRRGTAQLNEDAARDAVLAFLEQAMPRF